MDNKKNKKKMISIPISTNWIRQALKDPKFAKGWIEELFKIPRISKEWKKAVKAINNMYNISIDANKMVEANLIIVRSAINIATDQEDIDVETAICENIKTFKEYALSKKERQDAVQTVFDIEI